MTSPLDELIAASALTRSIPAQITPASEEAKNDADAAKPASLPDPPSLAQSEAYDTLKLFDHLGLGGDDVSHIFDSGYDRRPLSARDMMQMGIDASLTPLQENTVMNAMPPDNFDPQALQVELHISEQRSNIATSNITGMPSSMASGALPVHRNQVVAQVNAPVSLRGGGAVTMPSAISTGTANPYFDSMQSGVTRVMNTPVALRGGKQPITPKGGIRLAPITPRDVQPDALLGSSISLNLVSNQPTERLLREVEASTPHYRQLAVASQPQQLRPQYDIKDMDEYQEVTSNDIEQLRDMLENTTTLIGDMLELCNARSYGLRKLNDDQTLLEKCMRTNIANYSNYVEEQLSQYRFNVSSNAIVDLIGVPHTMEFNIPDFQNGESYPPVSLEKNYVNNKGFVLFHELRLTSYYYWNQPPSIRVSIDNAIQWCINTYIHNVLLIKRWRYPTQEMLQGIKKETTVHFEGKQWLFYCFPEQTKKVLFQGSNLPPSFGPSRQNPMPKTQNYCVVIFPDHKKHLGQGMWSRSVCYFDNVARGSQISFMKQCQQENWGIVSLNPNKNEIESQHFRTKVKKSAFGRGYNYGIDGSDGSEFVYSKNTETITLPTSESSKSHILSIYQHLIKPEFIEKYGCKLLLLSHCQGGEDILHLLEQLPECHKHIIGVAMLDFYTWSLEEMSKKTRQVIEQRSAVYMSLHGSNESAYGFEPSAAKSAVTIFRTANKEKRYSPIYNQESVVRFFKSKIELNQEE